MGGSASIIASALDVCKKGGRVCVRSPLTLLPRHSTLSRATQTLAKERENRGDPDWQENKCYRYLLTPIQNKTKRLSVQTEHTQSSSVTTQTRTPEMNPLSEHLQSHLNKFIKMVQSNIPLESLRSKLCSLSFTAISCTLILISHVGMTWPKIHLSMRGPHNQTSLGNGAHSKRDLVFGV